MKLPKNVKICHLTYEIIPWNPDSTSSDAYGLCSTREAKIWIAKAPLQIVKDTLLHEILHGIHYWYGVNGTSEEDTVSKIGTGLTQVLTDNPKVARFLLK